MAFPDDPLDITVSVAYDADPSADPSAWTFTAITDPDPAVNMVRPPVVIERGRRGEQGSSQPGACAFDIRNPEGVFSPRNPNGANYGRFGMNTPIRVEVNPGSGDVTRSTTFAAAWPPRWTGPDLDDHVPMLGNGVLRRLGQGSAPKSALNRTYSNADVLAYWPMEDEGPTLQIASGLSAAAPVRSPVELEFVDGQPGTLRALSMVGYDSAFFLSFPVTLPDALGWQMEIVGVSDAGADTSFLQIHYGTVAGNDVNFDIATVRATGDPHHYALRFYPSGANVAVDLYVDGAFNSTNNLGAGTLTTTPTISLVLTPSAAPNETACHLAVYSSTAMTLPTTRGGAADGYAGELAHVRAERVCDEEGVPVTVTANLSVAMGAQPTTDLIGVLADCETADFGLLVDRFDGTLGFDSHTDRENLPVTMTLDYEEGRPVPPLTPTDDDRYVRNDVTATRTGGSSSRVVQTDGPLGVTAVGRYDASFTGNWETDAQTLDGAGWAINLGTVDEPRYPLVCIDLHYATDLIDAWLACDIGSRIQITNAPTKLVGPGPIDLIIEGYTEILDANYWRVELNCAPYAPYLVAVLAEDDMTLLTAETPSSTTWRVASLPNFTTRAADLPVSLMCGGEEVSVTAVTPVTVSQTVGTAAHADNASVTPTLPAHAEGELLIIVAAIRSSGTGTVADLAGYTSLYTFGNMRIFAKYAASAAEANPVVTFTGGAAGDTCSAQAIRYRGLQISVLNSKEQLNGSAQDIAFPCYVTGVFLDVQVLQFCWKQDDYTSVASGASMTEVFEASSTLGNDQSLYMARNGITVDAVQLPAASHTVTGGASAISRVVFLTLPRGVYDMTVTRSVNGVVASHAQLADVSIAHPAILAL